MRVLDVPRGHAVLQVEALVRAGAVPEQKVRVGLTPRDLPQRNPTVVGEVEDARVEIHDVLRRRCDEMVIAVARHGHRRAEARDGRTHPAEKDDDEQRRPAELKRP